MNDSDSRHEYLPQAVDLASGVESVLAEIDVVLGLSVRSSFTVRRAIPASVPCR
jgi:hypothetical protein